MKKGNLLLRFLLVFLCLPLTGIFAQSQVNQSKHGTADANVRERTPIETFIHYAGLTNKFVEVSNIWAPDEMFDKTALLQNVTKAQPLTIDYTAVAGLIQKNTFAISLVIPGINGGTYTIDLAQYSPLHNDFKMFADAGNGKVTQVEYTPGKYYSGVVHGIPGSVAGFSFFNSEVYGVFSIPGVGNLVLVPNTMVSAADHNPNYILYNDMDMKNLGNGPKCDVDQLDLSYLDENNTAGKTTTTLNNNVYQNCKEVNILEVADYRLYTDKSSSTTNVGNYLSAMFNNQAIIYRNESLIINLKAIKVNIATDIYQTLTGGSSAFLNAFGDDIQNTYNTVYGCNLAHLLTTRPLGLGGVAWVGVMCASYNSMSHSDATAFSNINNTGSVTPFPAYTWNIEVLCHEMGHNLNSRHTHACVWNGTNTAIDGCQTLEGSCAPPVPLYPAAGGTIMSYCHLVTGVGINFNNGFGTQPGNVIRTYVAGRPATCGPQYRPDSAMQTANTSLLANRECTDLTNGITYYWNDNNTADQKDDALILMIKKGSNNIGNLNTSGFTVSANTLVNYGTGIGDTLSFPGATSTLLLAQNYGMRRYWKIAGATNPSAAIEVMFPFRSADTNDVHGSVALPSAPLTNYMFYKANTPVDPNPASGFPGSVGSNFTIYSYSVTPTTTGWSFSTVGTGGQTKVASMLISNLNGGGTGFYSYCTPHPAPVMGTLPPPPCPGATATYSVTADPSALSYVWTVFGTGWSGSSTTGSIVLTAGTGIATITVKAVDTCNAGAGYTFNITPAPLPAVSLAPTSGLCTTDATAVFGASLLSGGPVSSYVWTVTGTGWSGSSSTSALTATPGTGVGVIKVHAINTCGAGPDATYNASMTNTAPPAPASVTPPALACPSSTATFTTPAVAGATYYTWAVSGLGWSGISSTSSILVNVGTGLGTLTVSASNLCGTSPDFSYNMMPSTAPGAATAIVGPTLPCSGTSITLTTPAVATASSYNWVVTGTGWSGSSSTGSITVLVGTGTGNITVTPSNACGVGLPYSTSIVPTTSPSSTFALSSHTAPVNQDVLAVYTGSASAGSVFTWSFPGGGVATPGTGSGPQSVHWPIPGQYLIFLNVSNGSGCSSAYADTVNVIGSSTALQNLNISKIDADIVPNPSNGAFDIMFTESIMQPLSVRLLDIQGRVVYNNHFKNALSKKISVETDNLPLGTYIVTINMNDVTVSKRITIVR